MRSIVNRQAGQFLYTPLQEVPLRGHRITQFVDIHCHCLPDLDDGPETMEDAIALCRALVLDGITQAIATPHQMGCYEGRNDAREIKQAVSDLNRTLVDQGIPLAVSAGADVRVDERMLRMLDDDLIVTLADGKRYILLELPHDTFIDISLLLDMLLSLTITSF